MLNRLIPALIAAPLLVPSVAHAEALFGNDPARDQARTPADASALTLRPGFGVRVGGYGFRPHDGSSGKWDDCRMQGLGLFATLDLTDHFFTSLSADLYGAAPEQVATGMDRDSTHALAGVGVRMFPHFYVSPQLELGGGMEWTQVRFHDARSEGIYPVGFLGLGAALHVTPAFELGGSMRVLATTQAVHPEPASPSELGQGLGSVQQALTGEADHIEMRFGLAAQGQLFARYSL